MSSYSAVVLAWLCAIPGPTAADHGYLIEAVPGVDGRTCLVNTPYQPKEGDLIFFRFRSVFKNLMYAVSCAGGVSHVVMVVRRPDGTLGVLDAPTPGMAVELGDIAKKMFEYDGQVWVRPLRRPLSEEAAARLACFSADQVGKPYATLDALVPMLGPPHRRRILGHKRMADLDRPGWICSGLVVAGGVVAGLLDPQVVRPRYTDPADMFFDGALDLSPCWGPPIPWSPYGAVGLPVRE